ncbi:MAG: hypothetical protein L6R45_10560 [Anaerolineae bacterium]|nr:hypothetical protein [Anaerolineae bacterium]
MGVEGINLIQIELRPGEKLLWSGRPEPKRLARQGGNVVMVVFGLVFIGFAVLWLSSAIMPSLEVLNTPLPEATQTEWMITLLAPLFSLPFLLVGLGLMSVPYWAYRQAFKTMYALTDQRAMIIVNGKTLLVSSYSDKDIGDIEPVERSNGRGDLIFASELVRGRGSTSYTRKIGFIGIPDVRMVEQLMLDTFKRET